MQKLNEIVSQIKQPQITNEMIKEFASMINFGNFYSQVQEVNSLNDGTKINREEEQELFSIKKKGWNQKNQFQHMGSTNDIDYAFSRLYINCSRQDTIAIAKMFTEECYKRNLPVYFKYALENINTKRADQIVIYSNLTSLADYIDILRSIAEQNPELVKRCGKPPMLTGTIDEWIGIGDEPIDKADGKSFAEVRTNAIQKAILNFITEDNYEDITFTQEEYERIRIAIKEELKKQDIDMDRMSFNESNIELYQGTEQERQEFDIAKKQTLQKEKETQEVEKMFNEEFNFAKKLKKVDDLLNQLGEKSEVINNGVVSNGLRKNFLSDMAKKTNTDIFWDITQSVRLKYNHHFKNMDEATDKEKREIAALLYEEVSQYYKTFFEREAGEINNTINEYLEISRIEEGQKDTFSKAKKINLMSKLQLLAKGNEFFGGLGIEQDKVDEISRLAGETLQKVQENEQVEDIDTSHETGIEIVINALYLLNIRNREQLKSFYLENKANIRYGNTGIDDIEVSPEELESMLDETMRIHKWNDGIANTTSETTLTQFNSATVMVKDLIMERDERGGTEQSDEYRW